jgi:MFS family permease
VHDAVAAGLVIATAIWLPIAAMPEHQLLTWGWRIPFLLSAVLAIAGLVIRRAQKAAGDHEMLTVPLAELLRPSAPLYGPLGDSHTFHTGDTSRVRLVQDRPADRKGVRR